MVADNQPVKLAAMEGQFETQAGAPLLAGRDLLRRRAALRPGDPVRPLAADPPRPGRRGSRAGGGAAEDRPPVNVVHLAYNAMVGIGSALLLLAAVFGWFWWKRRRICRTPTWFLRAVAVSGVAAIVAMEAGWVTTEVGRQPWIVYGVLRTADAVSPAPGLYLGFYAVVVIYVALTGLTVYVLRRLAHRHDTAGAAGGRRRPRRTTAPRSSPSDDARRGGAQRHVRRPHRLRTVRRRRLRGRHLGPARRAARSAASASATSSSTRSARSGRPTTSG